MVAGWRRSDSGELSDQSPRVFGRFFLCEVSGVGHQRVVDMGKPDGAEAVQVVADLAAFLLARRYSSRVVTCADQGGCVRTDLYSWRDLYVWVRPTAACPTHHRRLAVMVLGSRSVTER